MNLCIQVKNSLRIGCGIIYKLCWGDAGASFFAISGDCFDRGMWIQSKKLFSSAGRWFRQSLMCSCLVSRVAPQP